MGSRNLSFNLFDHSSFKGLSPDFVLAFTSSHQPPDVFDYAAIDRDVPNMDQASTFLPPTKI